MTRYMRRGVHGQTVETIALRILAGDMREGTTLDIGALQSELEVSLTALREALKVLSAKGLVDARQKRGTYVLPRSDWNLLDDEVIRWQFAVEPDHQLLDGLHEIRAIIEPAAARIAAERAEVADVDRLTAAVEEMAGTGEDPDPRAIAVAHSAFHRELLAATHNAFLRRLDAVVDTDLDQRRRCWADVDSWGRLRQHREVLAAICARDPVAAEGAMHRLLDSPAGPNGRTGR